MNQIKDHYLMTRLTDSRIESFRKYLDPYVHDQFIERRKKIQNSVVRELISQLSWRSILSDQSLPVLTCLIGENEESKTEMVLNFVKAESNTEFLCVSTQDIRTRIPEFARYQELCPDLAASLTQKEAETVLELTIYASVYLGLHVLAVLPPWEETRLRHFLSSVKRSCEGLRLSAMYVTSNESSKNQQSSESFQSTLKSCFDSLIAISVGDGSKANAALPRVVFPWFMNWSKALVSVGLCHPPVEDDAPSPVFHLLAPSTDESTDDVIGSSRYFTAVTSSTGSVHSDEDNYITCAESQITTNHSWNDTGDGTHRERLQEPPVATWMIERLRLYHHVSSDASTTPNTPSTGRKRSIQRGTVCVSEPIATLTPPRPFPRECYLCRVDKLPSPNRHCPAASSSTSLRHQTLPCQHTLTDG